MSQKLSVLIVVGADELATAWAGHLESRGIRALIADGQQAAVDALLVESFDIIVMDIVLQDGSSMAIADFVAFRHPHARIIFVTNTSFFADGSLFRLIPNACAYLKCESNPEDLTAMVEHYAVPH